MATLNHNAPCVVKRAGIVDGVFLTAQSSGNGVGDVSQRLIPAGEQSGLPTRIATETVSSFVPMKS